MRRADIVAGISIAGLMLPEAVAYAGVAGLPPQRAVFAAIAGCLGYALLGRSRFAVVSPTSSSAAVLAATLATMAGSPALKAVFATVMIGLAGLLFLLASALRLGGLTGFIARPVLRGFAFGLAITIIVHQLPALVGADVHATDILHLAEGLVASVPRWNMFSTAVGGVTLAALILLRRFPALPGVFVTLMAGIAASWLLALPAHGVALVGPIDIIPPWPILPVLGWSDLSRLSQLAPALVLILLAESWGTVRTLALRHGDTVQADRELGALGLANLASALVQGLPVGAGYSAGSASEAAGAETRFAAVIGALALAGLVACAMPLVAQLPETVLAAVVIAALAHSLDPAPLARLWRLDRDQYVALAAAAGVLLLGVLDGMLLAIGLSLLALIRRLAVPHVARLGRLDGGHDYVDIARHADAVAPGAIAIWRPAEKLFFANAERSLASIATNSIGQYRAIVVSLEESVDIDSTALDALVEFDQQMRAAGVRVQYARVHDRVRDLLTALGTVDLMDRSSYSVDDAVTVLTMAAPEARP